MPAYYRKALSISEVLLAVYFTTSLLVLWATTHSFHWFPLLTMAGAVVCLMNIDKLSAKMNLFVFSVLIAIWLTWFVCRFGWSSGAPNILVPILSLAFFNIYLPPRGKIAYFLTMVVFRIGLFAFSLSHAPTEALAYSANLIFQVVNSLIPLLILVVGFILFSSSIQESERALTINNQELHREAGTDPLTGLPNRRAILDVIEKYRDNNPDTPFGIAIADIDFFKRVNDTYGHACGDYTLQQLSALFLRFAEGRYSVCRWGGEEFFFFLPGMNLDEAGSVMLDLNTEVKSMPLHFNDIDFSITITIGVEEYDFHSATEILLDRADRKLYMGKVHGRDQVVI